MQLSGGGFQALYHRWPVVPVLRSRQSCVLIWLVSLYICCVYIVSFDPTRLCDTCCKVKMLRG